MGNEKEKPDRGSDSQVLEHKKTKLKRPQMYMVVVLNDDFTPQDFVVWVLSKVFRKSTAECTRIMLEAHNHGKATVGIYPFDVAKTKVMQVVKMAKDNEHPLECRMEAYSDGGED